MQDKDLKELKKLIEKNYNSIMEACIDLDISRQTYYNWINKTHTIPKIYLKYLRKL